jgi:hypothetical protein
MPRPGRAAIILLAGVLVLTGCGPSKKQMAAQFAHDDAVVAAPPLPTHYALSTKDTQINLALPAGIDRYPELHAKLYNDGKAELLDFLKHAIEDRQRFANKGVKQATPYERRVVWSITAVSPHLISLRNTWFDDTGGAHPNHGSGVLLWDRVRNVMVLQAELFKPDADTAVVDTLLCQATTKAKAARLGPTNAKGWSCPKFADGHAVMVPSAQPYRIGGMMFLFDPYTIGAYAEGDYEVLLPLADFKSILAPGWAVDFAGSPAPSVRPRP